MASSLLKFAGFVLVFISAMLINVLVATTAEKSVTSGLTIGTKTEAQQCIRPTEFMRRNHMELLKHKRDQTMRQGIRTKDASLQQCVECHSKKAEDGTPIPINAPGQFCTTCHEYAAVKLDCFECHRTTPELPEFKTEIPDIPAHAQLLAAHSSEVQNLRSYLSEAK